MIPQISNEHAYFISFKLLLNHRSFHFSPNKVMVCEQQHFFGLLCNCSSCYMIFILSKLNTTSLLLCVEWSPSHFFSLSFKASAVRYLMVSRCHPLKRWFQSKQDAKCASNTIFYMNMCALYQVHQHKFFSKPYQ